MGLKTLQWLARILAIAAIIFMLMFSFDAFSGDEPLGKKLLGFLILENWNLHDLRINVVSLHHIK